MDSKTFAKKLSDLVIFVPPIAYGALLWESTSFLELLIASFIFFAFFPYYLVEAFRKLPRTPENKTRAVGQFLLSFVAGFVVQWAFNAPPEVLAFSASLAAGHFVAYLITPYWMISTHSLLSMQPLTVFVLKGRIEAWLVLIIFLVFGWARIHLKAHTPMQYVMGGVVGVILTTVAMLAVG